MRSVPESRAGRDMGLVWILYLDRNGTVQRSTTLGEHSESPNGSLMRIQTIRG